MFESKAAWPSGDCKPVIATRLSPAELAGPTSTLVFRDRDDLDWFEGAWFQIEKLGAVLIMKHENNPQGLTGLYVDLSCDAQAAQRTLAKYFGLSGETIAWQC
jgi:hypothetical protein